MSSIIAICVRSAIWRTNIDRSTDSRRDKNSESVIIVPRLRVKSLRSRRSYLSPRSRRSYLSPRSRRPRLSLRSERSGRGSRTRASRTFTTVITPSSSMVSPGVTPSPRARRRRRRLGVAPSVESSVLSCVESSLLSSTSAPVASLPPRRRPRPPRRRRRRASSLSSVDFSAGTSATALAGLVAFTFSVAGAA